MGATKKEVEGRAKGAIALAEKMSPVDRKKRASAAAAARWGTIPKTIRKGSFKQELGLDVDCYVLDDAYKTAVITQSGMGEILGLGSGGSRLPRFVFNRTMSEYVWPELRQKLENPIVFHVVGSGQSGLRANGYDVTILIEICQAIVKAVADGKTINPAVVAQANIITGAAAKSGIRGLVYALSGYNPTAQEVIDAFKIYVQQEARKYEQEFPNELYLEWHRLYSIPVLERGRSWHFKHLTVNHIYYPLAKSNGKILELIRALKTQGGDRQKKLFQFLNDVGARALRIHIGRVLEMAESSNTPEEYDSKITARFGGQQELDLTMPDTDN